MKETNEEDRNLNRVEKKVDDIATQMQKMSLAEYVAMHQRPWRMLLMNFLFGIMRGFGFAVGFTIVGALFLYFMGNLAAMNLPIVGEFIAEIAQIVQDELNGPSF